MMLMNYKCQHIHHNYQQVQGTCENLYCKSDQRKVCLSCYKLHEQDYEFNSSDIKDQLGLEKIFNDFKQGSFCQFKTIILQCDIQQYILNLKLIEFVKLWNYKSDKLNQIKQNTIQFCENDWSKINIKDYLADTQTSNGAYNYLRNIQFKLSDIDEQKNHYLKNIVNENNYEHQRFIKPAQELINILQKNQDQEIKAIKENPVFKQQQNNENTFIAMSEILLKEGNNLKVDIQYHQFHQLKNHLFKDIDKDKITFIEIYSQIMKQNNQPQELEKAVIKIKSLIQKQPHIPKYHFTLGKLYFLLQNYKLAHDLYSIAIKLNPLCSDYYYELGVNYEKLNLFDSAIQMYDFSLQLNPNHFQSNYNKAIILRNNQDYKSVLLILNKAIQIKPEFIELYNIKCEIFMNILNQYELALDTINEAIRIQTYNPQCYILRGQLHTRQKQFEKAIQDYNKVIEINPDDFQGYFSVGEILFLYQQKYQQALHMFDQSLVKNDKHIQSYLYKVKILYWFLKNHQQAIIFCDKIINLDSKNIEALEIKGEIQKNSLKLQQALEIYDQLIKIDSTKNQYYIKKGEILQLKCYHKEALQVYDILIQMAPRNVDIYEIKAQILANKLNKHEEAIQVYNQYLTIDQNHFKFNFYKAVILFEQLNQYKEAIEQFDKCIKFNPSHFDSHFYKAEILLKLNLYSNAVVAYDKCIQLHPNHFNSLFQKALLLEKLQNYQDAIKSYDQCIKNNNRNWQPYNNKAKILLNQKQYQLAVNVYKAYISIIPNHFDSYYSLAEIFYKDNQPELAIEHYEYCIDIDPNNYISYKAIANVLLNQYVNGKHLLSENKKWKYQAISTYQQYLQRDPQCYDCYFQIALIYKQLQMKPQALSNINECIKIDPTNYQAYQIKGILLNNPLSKQSATQCFKKALELNALDEKSKRFLNKLQGNITTRIIQRSKSIKNIRPSLH